MDGRQKTVEAEREDSSWKMLCWWAELESWMGWAGPSGLGPLGLSPLSLISGLGPLGLSPLSLTLPLKLMLVNQRASICESRTDESGAGLTEIPENAFEEKQPDVHEPCYQGERISKRADVSKNIRTKFPWTLRLLEVEAHARTRHKHGMGHCCPAWLRRN